MVDFSYIENISIDFQTPRGYIISTNVHLKAHNRQTIGFLGTFLNIKTSLWIPYHQIKQSIGGISSFYKIYILCWVVQCFHVILHTYMLYHNKNGPGPSIHGINSNDLVIQSETCSIENERCVVLWFRASYCFY